MLSGEWRSVNMSLKKLRRSETQLVTLLIGWGLSAPIACKNQEADAPPEETGVQFGNAIQIKPRFEVEGPRVVIDVGLRPGFHVYTTGETVGRPLKIDLTEGGDWKAAQEPVYPSGRTKETALGSSVVVEREARVQLPVEPLMDNPGSITGTFEYQVCTDVACDRPRTLPFKLETGTGDR